MNAQVDIAGRRLAAVTAPALAVLFCVIGLPVIDDHSPWSIMTKWRGRSPVISELMIGTFASIAVMAVLSAFVARRPRAPGRWPTRAALLVGLGALAQSLATLVVLALAWHNSPGVPPGQERVLVATFALLVASQLLGYAAMLLAIWSGWGRFTAALVMGWSGATGSVVSVGSLVGGIGPGIPVGAIVWWSVLLLWPLVAMGLHVPALVGLGRGKIGRAHV